MATSTKSRKSAAKDTDKGSEAKAVEIPEIISVDEAPTPRRGRTGADVSGYYKFLKDQEWHAIQDVPDASKKEAFARQLRRAASRIDMEVSTTFVQEEERLYFRGYPQGEAPPRGRRSKDTRTNLKDN